MRYIQITPRYTTKIQNPYAHIWNKLIDLCRFLHPIIYGEYPKSLQVIVKERLPKFTADEVHMVKGSIDYVGINQYTAYYVRDQQPNATTLPSYSSDWHAAPICESSLQLNLTT